MSTSIDDRAVKEAGAKAVVAHFSKGTPLPPEVAARVRKRSERLTEQVRKKSGTVDVAVDLIREGRDEV